MSRFTKAFNFSVEFDGDTVTGSMTRMKRGDIAKFSRFLRGDDLTPDETFEAVTDGIPVLSEHVQSFSGLLDADGVAMEFKDTVDESYFLELHLLMITELLTHSMVQQGQEGNSAGQLPSSTIQA